MPPPDTSSTSTPGQPLLPSAPPRVFLPPPPPPPRRTVPAPPLPSRITTTATLEMPSASYTGYSVRTRVGSLWTRTVAPKIGEAALGLSRGIQDLRERREWESHASTVGREAPMAPTERGARDESVTSGGGGAPSKGWRLGGIASYITGSGASGGGAVSGAKDPSVEEKVVCFPGWATIRPSPHVLTEPALVIEVLAHGHAYSLRPLSQASRTQRVFYSLAKSFAALPKIPANLGGGSSSLESLGLEEGEGQGLEAAEGKNELFEQLVHIGEHGGEETPPRLPSRPTSTTSKAPLKVKIGSPIVESSGELTSSPTEEDAPRLPSPDADNKAILETPARIARRPRTGRHGSANSVTTLSSISAPPSQNSTLPPPIPPKPASMRGPPTRSSTASSSPTTLRTPTRSTTASSSSTTFSQLPPFTRKPYVKNAWPQPFAFVPSDLPRLHANLSSRLLSFFGTKLPLRKVRLTIYPALPPHQLVDPKPLATKIVTTSPSGAFRTHLDVRSKALNRLLEDTRGDVGDLQGMKLRVVAELLEDDQVGDVLTGGAFNGHRGLRVVNEDEAVLTVATDGGVRLISDIDDTIKWTEVLAGTKTIFRNVFVRELQDIAVPGMADWYQAMAELGVKYHYVSNMPWELWGVTKEYLSIHEFPSGSVTLKEYGGASSALAKLWEDPGSRKRAGVESILKEFPHCRFILVGDSGEQDLNLYVSLAREYPAQVLAIYIRDVTTPFKPDAHPNLDAPKKAATTTDFREMDDMPGSFEGSPEPVTSVEDDDAASFIKRSATSTSLANSFDSSSSLPNPRPPAPPLLDRHVDALSPNNPLRPASITSSSPTEERAALIETFYARIREAERVLPDGIKLTIFRHGRECQREGVAIVQEALGKFGGA